MQTTFIITRMQTFSIERLKSRRSYFSTIGIQEIITCLTSKPLDQRHRCVLKLKLNDDGDDGDNIYESILSYIHKYPRSEY